MTKRNSLLSLVLALCLCFMLAVPAWATETEQTLSIQEMFEEAICSPQTLSDSEPIQFRTILSNEAGEEYLVSMFEYLPARRDDSGVKSRTFVYSTDSEYITPYANGLTQTNTSKDNSLSVYGTITATYNENAADNSALLTKVNGGWERTDRSVTMKDREVIYACNDLRTQNQLKQMFPSSDSFSYSTGFSKYILPGSPGAILAAQSRVNLSRGTSSSYWTLKTEANVFQTELPFPFSGR